MRNFLFLIVLFFLGQWLLKKLRRANERAQQGDTQSGAGTAGNASAGGTFGARRARTNGNGNGAATGNPPQLADPLIRCAQCGVHTPRSESIIVAGERFCCADHARHYASRPAGRDAR
ncbi:pyrimidine deaminase [Caballeronia hypogeia]|uniref:Pyrimidine deaminase n=1 Tax=Caballeronia hypogeia TaxID=1777140 RepID=A0A158CMR0_9BURK|nr:PP0621 family protein [Caballeronia hypogeia]SAK83683.1 pyrimidine deaminase [Caballeronia hypogeia]